MACLLATLAISLPVAHLDAAHTDETPPELPAVMYQTGFETASARAAWGTLPAGARWGSAPNRDECARVERPAAQGPGTVMLRLALPVERLRGARVQCEAQVRATDVAPPPNPWNGLKVMLHTVAPEGKRWDQQNNVFGTFDWKRIHFLTTVPREATEAWLMIGLENTTGTAWFDDLKVTVLSLPRSRPATPPTGPVYKGHNLPRLRGAMIGPRVGEADLRVLGQDWKANHVRWQLIWGGFPHSPADNGDLAAYDRWLEGELTRLDQLLPVCAEVGIHVLIDLHTPPGGRDPGSVCRLFQEQRFQDKFVAVWEKIARRYRGNPTVWGYDLVNEPVEGSLPDGLRDWRALARLTAQRVRAIDADHALIIEPAPWGSPESLVNFEPLDVPRVVYSVHIYQPHQFTHQGVYDNPVGLTYPGMIAGQQWDQDRLRKALQPVVDFQRDFNVHIYIGEFSAIRWAPGNSAHDYLRDVIELCEEHGWDWAYHAFREWNGWSVEHGPDKQNSARSAAPTDRERLLRSWFEKNAPGAR